MIKFPPVLYGVSQDVSIISEAINADGSPATSTLVLLYRENIYINSCITDAAGVYRFDNLVDGNYKVRINFKDGSDPLYVDFTSSKGTLIGPLSTSITTSASFTITTAGSSTTVSLSSSGSRYSYYCPPLITTDDGHVGKGLVSFTTGSLTGISTIASGTGSATTAITSTYSEPEFSNVKSTISTFANTSYGTSTGANNGLAFYYALQDVYAAVNNDAEPWYSILVARIGPAYPPWSDPPSVIQNGSAWRKKYDFYFNSRIATDGASTTRAACVTWYPAGTVTVYGNSAESLNILRSYDGFSQISLQTGSGIEGIGVFRVWNMEIIDLSGYCHEIPSNPPGLLAWNEYPLPDFGCGWNNSYADYVAKRTAANRRVTAYTKAKLGKLPLKNDLPQVIKDALDFLGLSGEVQGFIRYVNNYSTYSALQRVADERATQAIKTALELYGPNSKAFEDAKAAAYKELNEAKGYLATEFFIKPMLNLLADLNPLASAERGAIDFLRGVPSGTTRADVISLLSAGVSTAINAYYQTVESPALGIVAAIALTASGFPTLGLSVASATLGSTIADRNARDGIPGDSAVKSINDFIDQTQGTFTQPSWLNGTSYDTFDLFSRNALSSAGKRVTFSASSYSTTNIAAPDDALLPYKWDSGTGKYVTNP